MDDAKKIKCRSVEKKQIRKKPKPKPVHFTWDKDDILKSKSKKLENVVNRYKLKNES